MANTSRIKGFQPVRRMDGSPYTGSFNIYSCPASDGTALYEGDVVKMLASSNADGTKKNVTLAAAGDAVIGTVVGFGVNYDNLALSGQYRVVSTLRDVYVADSPDLVFEVEASNGTPAITDVGKNINHANGSGSATYNKSGATIDLGTIGTGATLTFRIIKFVPRPDNEVGASAKYLVKINNHQLSPGTGSAGV